MTHHQRVSVHTQPQSFPFLAQLPRQLEMNRWLGERVQTAASSQAVANRKTQPRTIYSWNHPNLDS